MRVAVRGSSGPVDESRFVELYQEIATELGAEPGLLVAYYTESVTPVVKAGVASLTGVASAIGSSSCQGVATHEGIYGPGDQGVALMGLADDGGSFGAAFAPFEDDIDGSVRGAYTAALEQADRPGELPSLVVLHSSPGHEETVIQTINSMTGGYSPIVGGSAADNEIAGSWSCFANDDIGQSGVAIALFFSADEIAYSFQSGYIPDGPSGIVTAADGRTIHEIDGQPAALVYNSWCGGVIDEAIAEREGSILAETTMSPLGRTAGEIDVDGHLIAEYTLIHPERVTADGGLALFADVEVGQELFLMTGSIDSLVNRAGLVIRAATRDHNADVAGGLVIYCAGCRLAVDQNLDDVRTQLNEAFGGAPYVVAFTFGEQGCLLGGENQHGNLMISAAVFN